MSKRKLTKREERIMAKFPETETFCWANFNPKGHITGDCVLRAISAATNMPWEYVLDGLHEIQRKYRLYNDKKAEVKYLAELGWCKHKQPKHPDGRRYTGAELARWLTDNFADGTLGPVICTVSRHMFCICPINQGDGTCKYKILDTWDSSGRTICSCWTSAASRVPIGKRMPPCE